MKTNKCLLAPSILSADFAQLGAQIQEAERAGADWIHVDVMDGHFVPNLTIGPVVVKGIRSWTKLPLDCHLMVENPEKWIKPFADAGADCITIHVEATENPRKILSEIRKLKVKAGISISPDTKVDAIEKFLDEVDLVLVMSVYPGFGGQSFIDSAYEKIRKIQSLQSGRNYLIEVDGGVTLKNIQSLKNAGAQVFVAGSSVFSGGKIVESIKALKKEIE